MEVLITGTNTRVMWERQPRTREARLGVGVKMEAAAAAAAAVWSEVTRLSLSRGAGGFAAPVGPCNLQPSCVTVEQWTFPPERVNKDGANLDGRKKKC